MTNTLTVGSLFAGIGGLELGLEMTGRFRTVWQVEQNEYCRKVLARHWPDATRFEDVRDVGKGNLPAVDVICGGFPCQDVSVAGKKAGIREGTRSGLWFEYARIIRELRPSYVIVENVPGLLAGGGLGVVLGELADSGYDAEWRVLSAASVGAPHLRRRVFLVAYANRRRAYTKQISRSERTSAPHASGHGAERSVADSDLRRCEQRDARQRGVSIVDASRAPLAYTDSERGRGRNTEREDAEDARQSSRRSQFGHWDTEPNVGRVANGVPKRVDRLRALGNAVVPQCARVVGERLLEIHDSLTSEGAA